MPSLVVNCKTGKRYYRELSQDEITVRDETAAKFAVEAHAKEEKDARIKAAHDKLAGVDREVLRKQGAIGEAVCDLLDALGL